MQNQSKQDQGKVRNSSDSQNQQAADRQNEGNLKSPGKMGENKISQPAGKFDREERKDQTNRNRSQTDSDRA